MRAATIARAARLAALVAVLLCALSAALQAEEKSLKGVALVIGQSKYAHIAPLANPANDAREMVKLLSDLGFDARSVSDRDGGKKRSNGPHGIILPKLAHAGDCFGESLHLTWTGRRAWWVRSSCP